MQMPHLSKDELLERFRRGLWACGYQCLIRQPSLEHPFRLAALREGAAHRLIVYVWNVTHGGGVQRPEDEYRIQLTGVDPPLFREPDATTLLLGWYQPAQTFVGFDIRLHSTFSRHSPSIQVKLSTLEDAAHRGIAFQDKGEGEIAVAFRPDLLMFYVQHQEELHDVGESATSLAVAQQATQPEEPAETDLRQLPEARRSTVREMRRWQRDRRFRSRVLTAYGFRCAVCGVQLDMVMAAHIIPVSEPGSTDETSNGLALCPDHHYAYDFSLVGVLPDYTVALNEDRIARLRDRGLDDGLESFETRLRDRIVLPDERTERPSPEYLYRGLLVRGWQADQDSLNRP